MIFGKTYAQKKVERKERADKLKALLDVPVIKFAFIPRQLVDSRWVWLRRVTKTLPSGWTWAPCRTWGNIESLNTACYHDGPIHLFYHYRLPEESKNEDKKEI